MAISVGSVSVNASSPVVTMPAVTQNGPVPAMRFSCYHISLSGGCELSGEKGDDPTGWTLGFIQVKNISTDWAYYRGETDKEGSLLLDYGRPPALPAGGCRDTAKPGDIFIDSEPMNTATVPGGWTATGGPFSVPLSIAATDRPSRLLLLSYKNSQTNKLNYLQEAQIELHFCTVLALRSPAGQFQYLKTVYWNVHWQATFEPTDRMNLLGNWKINAKMGPDMTANVSKIIDGPPMDAELMRNIAAPVDPKSPKPNCNDLSQAAFFRPNKTESRVWKSFNVGR